MGRVLDGVDPSFGGLIAGKPCLAQAPCKYGLSPAERNDDHHSLRDAAIRVWQPGERRQRRRVLNRWPMTMSAAPCGMRAVAGSPLALSVDPLQRGAILQ